MTKTEKEWLAEQEKALKRASKLFGGQIYYWEAYQYQKIISGLRRENRKMKTQLGVKF